MKYDGGVTYGSVDFLTNSQYLPVVSSGSGGTLPVRRLSRMVANECLYNYSSMES